MSKTAVILIKDNESKAAQEFFARVYALENDLDVLYVTSDLNEVRDCDAMLVAKPFIISREQKKYYEIVNGLKEKGIETKIILNEDNVERFLDFVTRGIKGCKKKEK